MQRLWFLVTWFILTIALSLFCIGPIGFLMVQIGSDSSLDSIAGRVALIIGAILFFAFFKNRVGLRSLGLYDPQWSRKLWFGILLGGASLVVIHALFVVAGGAFFAPEEKWSYCFKLVWQGFFSGIAVALIEEVFFRGIVFQTCVKSMPVVLAYVCANSFYALLHFFKLPAGVDVQPHMLSGFSLLPLLIQNALHCSVMHFIGLFIVGCILCYAFSRTHSLYLSMGLHGMWVFGLRVDGFFIHSIQAARGLLFGQRFYLEGMLSWCVLLPLFFVIGWYQKKKL